MTEHDAAAARATSNAVRAYHAAVTRIAGIDEHLAIIHDAMTLACASRPGEWDALGGGVLEAAGLPVSWPSSVEVVELLTERRGRCRELASAREGLKTVGLDPAVWER